MTVWERWASVVLLLGAASWLAKMAVIFSTDGRVIDTGAASVFYLAGVALMALGVTAVGLHFTRPAATWIRIVAMLASVIGFFVSYFVIDAVARPTLGQVGPDYMPDEAGILLTAIFWLIVAVVLIRARPSKRVQTAG